MTRDNLTNPRGALGTVVLVVGLSGIPGHPKGPEIKPARCARFKAEFRRGRPRFSYIYSSAGVVEGT
jgi:hypothetical protein